MSQDNNALSQAVIELITCADAGMQKAAAIEGAHRKTAALVEQYIPDAVEAMLKAGCIHAHEKNAAAQELRDPARAVQLLAKVAQHKVDNRPPVVNSQLGSPVGGSSNGGSSATVGRSTVKEADIKLFHALGLPTPTTGIRD